jgi:hypothetical protein
VFKSEQVNFAAWPQISVCGFGVTYGCTVLGIQKGQPESHFFLVFLNYCLKQRYQFGRSLRVRFIADFSAETANKVRIVHGEVAPLSSQPTDESAPNGRDFIRFFSSYEYSKTSRSRT